VAEVDAPLACCAGDFPEGDAVKRRLVLLFIAALVACRLGGGPSANPDEYVTFDSGADAALGDEPVSQGDDGTRATTDATVAEASTAPGDDASTSPDGGGDASIPEGSVGDGACAATVAVCDPIHNTGCNPLQQCDVDTTQTSTPTGLCLFNSGGDGGGACIMSFVSEACPPHQTCVGSACKALCFCNADCPTGQCCSDTSGPQGFTLCGVCH
jgi:hypothetical protein